MENPTIYLKTATIDFSKFSEIEVSDIGEFCKICNSLGQASIKSTETKMIFIHDSFFIFLKDQFCFKILHKGFLSLQDFLSAVQIGLPNPESYYNKIAIEKGFNNANSYFDASQKGFVGLNLENLYNHSRFLQNLMVENNLDTSRIYNTKHLLDAISYELAMRLKYKNSTDFEHGVRQEFKDGTEYYAMIELGFKNQNDYREAKSSGLLDSNLFYEAKELGFTSKTQVEFYIWSKKYPEEIYRNYDELFLIHYIEKLLGKQSIKKIYDEYKKGFKAVNNTQYNSLKYSKKLFSESIYDLEELMDFLKTNEIAQHIGSYDSEGEYFEKKVSLQKYDRTIVLDASNIAYNSQNNAYSKNIILVTEYLEKQAFNRENIWIVADKSLQHKVKDKDIFQTLKQSKNFHEAPAKTEADEFIIKYAEQENALIITNDQLADHCTLNDWLKQHINRIRVPFMIINEKVQLRGNITHFI